MKKVLAIVLAFALVFSSITVAFADTTISTEANALVTIGMLQGDGSGVTADYLAKPMSRLTAAISILRLRGVEAEAKAFTGTDNFADVKDYAWAEGKAIMAFLKANPQYGFGGDEKGNFNPTANMDEKSYTKVLLENLGYKQTTGTVSGDFTWDNVLTFAQSKGLVVANAATFTVDNLAKATVGALKAANKDGKVLVDELVAAGKIQKDKAVAAGLVVEKLTATAAATGAKKLTVTFNQAVDTTKATVAVKKGSITVNTSSIKFADDKKSIEITLASKITKGDYTITVSGLGDAITSTVTAEDEKVGSIEFLSDIAVMKDDNNVTVGYKVLNQYGEDITSTATASLTFSTGRGDLTTTAPADGVITVHDGTTTFKVNDIIALSILDPATATFKSVAAKVSNKAQVAEVTITRLYNSDSKAVLDEDATASDFKLVVEAKDQYGNKIPYDKIAADTVMTISDTTVANVAGGANNPTYQETTIDGTKYATVALAGSLKEGTTKVAIISKTTGKMATFDIVVKGGVKADVVTLQAPEVAVAGENITIPFTAIDQYGNAVTKASVLNKTAAKVTVTSSDAEVVVATPAFTQDYVKNTAKLVVDATAVTAAKKVTITAITSTGKISHIVLDIKAPKVAKYIGGTKDITTTNVLETGSISVAKGNVVVKDQYGRDMTITYGAGAGKYVVSATSSDETIVSVNNAKTGYIQADAGTLAIKGEAKGSATVTLKLNTWNDADTNSTIDANELTAIAGSEYAFTVNVVKKSDITSYEIGTISKLLENSADHDVTVKVYGVKADGTKVSIPTTEFTVASGNANVVVTGNKLHANASTVPTGKTEITVPVVVTINADGATQVIMTNVTVTNVSPEIVKLYLDEEATEYVSETVISVADTVDTQAAVDTLMSSIVKGEDQYGVDKTPTLVNIITNITDGKALEDVAAGDSFNVTSVAENGKYITIKVIVK